MRFSEQMGAFSHAGLAQENLFENALLLNGFMGSRDDSRSAFLSGATLSQFRLDGLLSGLSAFECLRKCEREPMLPYLLELHQDQTLWVHEKQQSLGDGRNHWASPIHKLMQRSINAILPTMPMGSIATMNRAYLTGHLLRLGLRVKGAPIGGVTWEFTQMIAKEGLRHDLQMAFLKETQSRTWLPRLLLKVPVGWVLVEENSKPGDVSGSAYRLSLFDQENDVVHSQTIPTDSLLICLMVLLSLPSPVTSLAVRGAVLRYLTKKSKLSEECAPPYALAKAFLRLPQCHRDEPCSGLAGWFAISTAGVPVHIESLLKETRHRYLVDEDQTIPQVRPPTEGVSHSA